MESMSQLPEQQGELQEVWLNLPSNDSDLPSPGAASDNPFSPTASSPPVACSPSEALQLFSETYGKYVHGELALGMCIVGIITNVANLMVCTVNAHSTSMQDSEPEGSHTNIQYALMC